MGQQDFVAESFILPCHSYIACTTPPNNVSHSLYMSWMRKGLRRTRTGFWSHMALSRNPLCRARERLDAFIKSLQESNSSTGSEDSVDSDEDDSGVGCATEPFEGDLFGTVRQKTTLATTLARTSMTKMSDWRNHPRTMKVPSSACLRWSLRIVGNLTVSLTCHKSMMPYISTQRVTTRITTLYGIFHLAERCLSAEERADSHPQIVRYSETYPLSQAGYIVASTGTSSDTVYTSSVNGQQNLWAPFTSEIDWKVACWA